MEPLKIPAFLYGTYAHVKRRCQPKLNALAKGATLADVTGDRWLEPATTEGLIALDGPIATIHGENFHCYVLTREAFTEATLRDAGTLQRLHEEGLADAWSLLGLQSARSSSFSQRTPDWQRSFIAAMVTHWEAFEAAGKRYSLGTAHADYFWGLPTTATKFTLAKLGLSLERIKSPLPAGGLAALARLLEPPTLN